LKSQYPNVISFKLDDYSLTQLENYCYANGRSTSAAIRDALALMFLRQERKKRSMTGNTEVDAMMKVFEK
jgi:hypothetical protein